MTPKENLLKLYKREGYNQVSTDCILCKSFEEEFRKRFPGETSNQEHFNFPYRIIVGPRFSWNFENRNMLPEQLNIDWRKYYPQGFEYDVEFDSWGIVHESSPTSMHMTKMHHPMKSFQYFDEMKSYPLPGFTKVDFAPLKKQMDEIHNRRLAVFVWQECTIWETAWYLRSMENPMMNMAMEDEMAYWLFDQITEKACFRAEIFAEQGADIIGLVDDIGMQETIMMPIEMFQQWLDPRLQKVIRAVKNVNPDVLINYHFCGYIEPFIPDLIEIGVDILNPVQPECMDFKNTHEKYGFLIFFNGIIGTQKLMPFGTPEEIKNEVKRNLSIGGEKGGLFCCPTHMLEPEVPWENIGVYVIACNEYESEKIKRH